LFLYSAFFWRKNVSTSYPTRFRGSDTPHIQDLVISNDSFIEEVNQLAP